MKYVEIVISDELQGKHFIDVYLVMCNNKFMFSSYSLEPAIQYLKDNDLYNDYLVSCE